MQDDVVERYADVLESIETAIVTSYEEDASLLDLDVLDALDAVIRRYVAEVQARTPPRLSLAARATLVYEEVEHICEWRLGRASLGEEGSPTMASEPIDLEVLLLCLKRVRKSVRFWNETAGRQGYLEYVSRFIE